MCIILYASGRQMFAVSYDIKFVLKKGFDVIKNLVQSCAILSSAWSYNASKRSGYASVKGNSVPCYAVRLAYYIIYIIYIIYNMVVPTVLKAVT